MFNVITTGLGNIISLSQAALTDLVNGTDTFSDVLAERSAESAEVLNELLGTDFFDVTKKNAASAAEEITTIRITEGKKLSDWEKLNDKQRLNVQQGFIKAASILSNEFLEDNKAVNTNNSN